MLTNPDPFAYLPIILATIVGFAILAAVLLIPVSRFITRERRKGEAWNEELRRRGYEVPDERLDDLI